MKADVIPQAVQHIVAVQKFLQSQRRVLPVNAYVKIEAGQCRAVSAIIDQLTTITAADATMLTDALDQYNWDADAATANCNWYARQRGHTIRMCRSRCDSTL